MWSQAVEYRDLPPHYFAQLHQFERYWKCYGICMAEHTWEVRLPHKTENPGAKGEPFLGRNIFGAKAG